MKCFLGVLGCHEVATVSVKELKFLVGNYPRPSISPFIFHFHYVANGKFSPPCYFFRGVALCSCSPFRFFIEFNYFFLVFFNIVLQVLETISGRLVLLDCRLIYRLVGTGHTLGPLFLDNVVKRLLQFVVLLDLAVDVLNLHTGSLAQLLGDELDAVLIPCLDYAVLVGELVQLITESLDLLDLLLIRLDLFGSGVLLCFDGVDVAVDLAGELVGLFGGFLKDFFEMCLPCLFRGGDIGHSADDQSTGDRCDRHRQEGCGARCGGECLLQRLDRRESFLHSINRRYSGGSRGHCSHHRQQSLAGVKNLREILINLLQELFSLRQELLGQLCALEFQRVHGCLHAVRGVLDRIEGRVYQVPGTFHALGKVLEVHTPLTDSLSQRSGALLAEEVCRYLESFGLGGCAFDVFNTFRQRFVERLSVLGGVLLCLGQAGDRLGNFHTVDFKLAEHLGGRADVETHFFEGGRIAEQQALQL